MLREVLTVSALIAVVLLVRAMFKSRVPKRMLYALWLVVLLKLCFPGTLVSLPVLPSEDAAAPTQSAEQPVQTAPVIQQPVQTVTQPQTPAQQPVSPAQEAVKSAQKPLTTAQILQIVWAGGSALLGLWLFGAWLVFTIRLRRDRRFLGKRGRTRIYASGAVKSPCLAGLIPAVYLTEDVLQADEAELILRHELTHLCHQDFLWSFCRAAAVTVYWWNPFIWLAAICSKRDAELACDEAVAAKLPEKERLADARAILAQAPRKTAALSLAGHPVKERIFFLTKKQRTSALCVILALLLVASATGCSFAELTRKRSGKIEMPEEAEEAAPADEIPADELPAGEAEIPAVGAETPAQEQTEQAPGFAQGDTEYDDVKTWSWAPYDTLYRTDGVRMGLVREADGTRHIGEVPDTKVWIRLKDGTLLSDEPFDACIDYMGEPEGEVYCIRNGTGYRYAVSAGDGSFRLSEVDEPKTLEEDHFGYRLRVTRWDSREPCYGIVTADGAEVIAPVYERVEIPFPNRFLLYEGGASQGPVMGRCRLTDETGSTLSARFHWIDYSVFDDGYIGIAVCYGERAAYPCYDEDGQPMPEGYWLVDRDGNFCSERFAKLSFGDGDETHAASKDDVLRAQREDGTETLLTVAELLRP